MVLGFVWFAMPVFGRTWMRETGKTVEQIKKGGTPLVYLGAVAGALVVAYGIAFAIENLALESLTEAIVLSILLWLAFFVMPTLVNFAFEDRSRLLFAIYVGNQLVAFLASAILYYVWPVA